MRERSPTMLRKMHTGRILCILARLRPLLALLLALSLFAAPGASLAAEGARPSYRAFDRSGADDYAFRAGTGGEFDAENPAQGLRYSLGRDGLHVSVLQESEPLLSLRLLAAGREGAGQLLGYPGTAGEPAVLLGRFERSFTLPGFELGEQYRNGPGGLQHSFTLSRPPARLGDEPLALELDLRTDIQPRLLPDGSGVLFSDHAGLVRLRYQDLLAWDAAGKLLPAWMELDKRQAAGDSVRLRILVDDRLARYPLTIDPLLTLEKAILLASDGAADDQFGTVVSVSGDYAAVSAPSASVGGTAGKGAVYLYRRNQGGADAWTQVKKITTGDNVFEFGISMALSGDLLAVGAPVSGAGGVVYIYRRNQGGPDNWGLVKTLVEPQAGVGEQFGLALSLQDDTLVVSAPYLDQGINANVGRVFVYQRNLGGGDAWGLAAALQPLVARTDLKFGYSLATDGLRVLVGVPYATINGETWQGEVYLFERNLGGPNSWGLRTILHDAGGDEMDFFGAELATQGDLIVISAPMKYPGPDFGPGTAFVYDRNNGGLDSWGLADVLTGSGTERGDNFGESLAISGEIIAVGAYADDYTGVSNSGLVYLFSRNYNAVDSWSELSLIHSSDRSENANFGYDLALSGNQLLVGASNARVGGNAHQGQAYAFLRAGSLWVQQAQAGASDGQPGDDYGAALAISPDFLASGAPQDNNGQGSLYLHYRNQGGPDAWGQVVRISAADGAPGDQFGSAAALSAGFLLVGAPGDDSDRGAAYLFYRNQGGADAWGQVAKITAADGAPGDRLGFALALSGGIAAAGAPGDVSGRGAAYLFYRNQGGADAWGQLVKLVASDRAAGDEFGRVLSLDASILAAGAPGDDSGSGAAYLFYRNLGGPDAWGEQKKLVDPAATPGDEFGAALALTGDLLAAGAPGSLSGEGTAYVFSRNLGGGDAWSQLAALDSGSGSPGDGFGTAVALSPDYAVVGAPGASSGLGRMLVFERNNSAADGWNESSALSITWGVACQRLGAALGLSANLIAAGAPQPDRACPVSFFRWTHLFQDLAITKTAFPLEAGPGDPLQFVLSFANSGDDIATGVVITDTLSTALTNIGYISRGAKVTLLQPGFVWGVEDLSPGESGVITVTANLRQAVVSGPLYNSAEIRGVEDELVFGNNTSTAVVMVDATPPAVPLLTSPPDDAVLDVNAVTLIWQASSSPDVAGYLLRLDGVQHNLGLQTSYFTGALAGGVHTWSVAAYDGFGNTSAFSLPWSFDFQPGGNQPPVALSGPDQSVLAGDSVILDGNQSYDPDGDLPLSFIWAQLGGAPVGFDPSAAVISFTAPTAPDLLIFSLTVVDSSGQVSLPDSVQVTITDNLAPVANAGPDRTVGPATGVTLDGSLSYDSDGDLPLSFNWTQQGGTPVSFDPSAAAISFTAPSDTDLLVFSLVVSDARGKQSQPDLVSVTVSPNLAPVAVPGDDQEVPPLAQVSLDGSSSYDPDGHTPLAYRWQQLSGMPVVFNASLPSISFVAPVASGELEFRLTVTDALGKPSAPASLVVAVQPNQAPVAAAGDDQTVSFSAQVTLDGSLSYDPDGHTPLVYQWAQVSGSPVTLTAAGAVARFNAPAGIASLGFRLVVVDSLGLASVPDSLLVSVVELQPGFQVYLPGIRK